MPGKLLRARVSLLGSGSYEVVYRGCSDTCSSLVLLCFCRYFNNAYYAKVGGVTTGEMNRLELEFLFRIDFRLNVTSEEFTKYCQLMEGELWRMQAPQLPEGHSSTHRTSCSVKAHRGTNCMCESAPMDTEVSDDCTVTTPPRESEPQRHPAQMSRVTSFTP